MMTTLVLPIVFALFAWWFSTGVVLYLDGLSRRTFPWTMAAATLVLAGALRGLAAVARDTSITGACAAFGFALLAWSWQEISFYTGYVTGPRPLPCPAHARGWRRFGYALAASLWHELAAMLTAGVVVAVSWDAPNRIGMWTFLVLWWMHESARINVFLGVANLSEEFLPEHMAFLRGYMTKRPINLLFPLSVTAGSVAAALLFARAFAGGVTGESVGCVLLATMLAVAVLEHWFLILPLPVAALWDWSLSRRRRSRLLELEPVRLDDLDASNIMIKRGHT